MSDLYGVVATNANHVLAPSVFGLSLLSAADGAAARTALGLGTMATQSASSYLPLAGGTLTGPITGSSGVVEQRNGSTAQAYRLFYTYTDASNYQGGALIAGANGLALQALTAGTGTDNLDWEIIPAGTGRVILDGPVMVGNINRNASVADGDIGLNVNNWLVGANSTTVKRLIAYESSYAGCVWIDPDAEGVVFSGMVSIGGLSASAPAMKRSGAELQFRLGDDSGYTAIDALKLLVNGTQVVGARGSAVADVASADATDLASAISLVNELKAQLNAWLAEARTHGLIPT